MYCQIGEQGGGMAGVFCQIGGWKIKKIDSKIEKKCRAVMTLIYMRSNTKPTVNSIIQKKTFVKV